MLGGVRDAWGLADDVEVTTEANPDSVTPAVAGGARGGRLHAGLVRHAVGGAARAGHPRAHARPATHPGRRALGARRRASPCRSTSSTARRGSRSTTGAPASRPRSPPASTTSPPTRSWSRPGTRMAVQVRRGELELPDGDDQATKYELADDLFEAAGLHWYEVSNWSRTPETACRHNLAYWRGDDWWGIGPGRAQPRRRRALVERQAPARLRRPARPRAEPGGRARDRRPATARCSSG